MPDLNRIEFEAIRSLVQEATGVVLPDGKEYLVQHRIGPLVAESGCDSFQDFLAKVRCEPGGPWFTRLVDAITTHETSFFRDGHPFDALVKVVFPWLFRAVADRKTRILIRRGPKARIWCTAVSTGQEAYSLAMLLQEYQPQAAGSGIEPGDLSILATDISGQVLATAMRGRYSGLQIARGLSPERRARFFLQVDPDCWEAIPALRAMVEYRYLNLLESFAVVGGCDVVLCRNVLIYFDPERRRDIVTRIRETLAPGGFLILGSAESLDQPLVGWTVVRHGVTCLYQAV